jgi:hypothetical protein
VFASDVALQHRIDDVSPRGLECNLLELRRNPGSTSNQANFTLARRLGEPDTATALLQGYLADMGTLTAVAARSYRHINHFDKIVLVDSGDQRGYRLTLHVWRPPYTDAQVNEELVHDHRFSFWSSVLAGQLVSQNYAVDGTSHDAPVCDRGPVETFKRYRYTPEKQGLVTTANFYEYTGAVALTMVGQDCENECSTYYLNYEQIHRVTLPRSSITCTLVLRGPRERAYSNVYNTGYPATDVQMVNVMFSTAYLAETLSMVVDAMHRCAYAPL